MPRAIRICWRISNVCCSGIRSARRWRPSSRSPRKWGSIAGSCRLRSEPNREPRGGAVFKIGDFSRIARVSCRLLRYYDEIGLLKPGSIERDTGYRYYSASQLPRLNRILVLKELGLSLEEIARVLDSN